MDKSDIKIIANYLPQYHRIPENDMWWGEGYTDWEAVKKAKAVQAGQSFPREPLGGNYYDLADPQTIRWQAELARQYGIWGFGIYHYWFSSEQRLLTKPAENLLMQPDVDINYLFIWDNCSWIRTWSSADGNDWTPMFDKDAPESERANSSASDGLLARLDYGLEGDWVKHFEYLLPFFKDPRYMRIDGKPVFAFMKPQNDFDTLQKMVTCWDNLAKAEGLNGVCAISKMQWRGQHFETQFQYQPTPMNNIFDVVQYGLGNLTNRIRPHFRKISYDAAWKNILRSARFYKDSNIFHSGFVGYDDTPRRGDRAKAFLGQTPEKFQHYLSQLLEICAQQGKEYMFLTAWNEWGETSYLEPDDENEYAYLEAVKRAIQDGNE